MGLRGSRYPIRWDSSAMAVGWQCDFDRASDGCSVRRTRSSRPWALLSRHPWRETVRRTEHPPLALGRATTRLRGGWGWISTRQRLGNCLHDTEEIGLRAIGVTFCIRVDTLGSGGGAGGFPRTVSRQGWRERSAQGWLERVRGNPPALPPRFNSAGAARAALPISQCVGVPTIARATTEWVDTVR